MEERLVQVRLREGKKSRRYLLPDEFDVEPGGWVVVNDDEEEDCGVVTSKPVPLAVEWEGVELPKVLEIPTEDEVEKALRLRREKEPNAIKKAYQKVRFHNLDIKLVQARFYHRSNKMKFHFSAENRVDFRELVRDLASLFHARIEMRQIGVRDAAAMIGGYGSCGEELCCSRFLRGFEPITIRMAKDQNLALNPSKISGCCGRLLCCLKYEHEIYVESRKHYPKNGTVTRYGDLEAKVSGFNILKQTVTLSTEGHVTEIPLEEFKRTHEAWRSAVRSTAGEEEETTSGVIGGDLEESGSVDVKSLEALEDTVVRGRSRGTGEESDAAPSGKGSGKRRRRRRKNKH